MRPATRRTLTRPSLFPATLAAALAALVAAAGPLEAQQRPEAEATRIAALRLEVAREAAATSEPARRQASRAEQALADAMREVEPSVRDSVVRYYVLTGELSVEGRAAEPVPPRRGEREAARLMGWVDRLADRVMRRRPEVGREFARLDAIVEREMRRIEPDLDTLRERAREMAPSGASPADRGAGSEPEP